MFGCVDVIFGECPAGHNAEHQTTGFYIKSGHFNEPLRYTDEEVEVLGSIYENPELLERD